MPGFNRTLEETLQREYRPADPPTPATVKVLQEAEEPLQVRFSDGRTALVSLDTARAVTRLYESLGEAERAILERAVKRSRRDFDQVAAFAGKPLAEAINPSVERVAVESKTRKSPRSFGESDSHAPKGNPRYADSIPQKPVNNRRNGITESSLTGQIICASDYDANKIIAAMSNPRYDDIAFDRSNNGKTVNLYGGTQDDAFSIVDDAGIPIGGATVRWLRESITEMNAPFMVQRRQGGDWVDWTQYMDKFLAQDIADRTRGRVVDLRTGEVIHAGKRRPTARVRFPSLTGESITEAWDAAKIVKAATGYGINSPYGHIDVAKARSGYHVTLDIGRRATGQPTGEVGVDKFTGTAEAAADWLNKKLNLHEAFGESITEAWSVRVAVPAAQGARGYGNLKMWVDESARRLRGKIKPLDSYSLRVSFRSRGEADALAKEAKSKGFMADPPAEAMGESVTEAPAMESVTDFAQGYPGRLAHALCISGAPAVVVHKEITVDTARGLVRLNLSSDGDGWFFRSPVPGIGGALSDDPDEAALEIHEQLNSGGWLDESIREGQGAAVAMSPAYRGPVFWDINSKAAAMGATWGQVGFGGFTFDDRRKAENFFGWLTDNNVPSKYIERGDFQDVKRASKELDSALDSWGESVHEAKEKSLLWMRLGASAKYEQFGSDPSAAAEALSSVLRLASETGESQDVIDTVRWRDQGLEAGPFDGQDHVSLFWGDDEAQPVRGLDRSEQAAFVKALRGCLKESVTRLMS